MNTLVIAALGGGQSPAKRMILPIAHRDNMMVGRAGDGPAGSGG